MAHTNKSWTASTLCRRSDSDTSYRSDITLSMAAIGNIFKTEKFPSKMKNHRLKLVFQVSFKTQGIPKILQTSSNAQHNTEKLILEKLQRKGSLSAFTFLIMKFLR
jgi:hypothetical protein